MATKASIAQDQFNSALKDMEMLKGLILIPEGTPRQDVAATCAINLRAVARYIELGCEARNVPSILTYLETP